MTDNQISVEQYIEHEVQMRVLNTKYDEIHKTFEKIDRRFDLMDAKIDSRFMLVIGLLITSIILPIALKAMQLV